MRPLRVEGRLGRYQDMVDSREARAALANAMATALRDRAAAMGGVVASPSVMWQPDEPGATFDGWIWSMEALVVGAP